MWQWLNLEMLELNCILLLCLYCYVLSPVTFLNLALTYCHIPFNCQPPLTPGTFIAVVIGTPPLLYVQVERAASEKAVSAVLAEEREKNSALLADIKVSSSSNCIVRRLTCCDMYTLIKKGVAHPINFTDLRMRKSAMRILRIST